DAS
ncbi:hypothetical protein CISIN_1g0353051mg, partial [Citrus sinensis]